MPAIIARNSNITAQGTATLYTADSSGTVSIRILNNSAGTAAVDVYATATPETPGDGDQIDSANLAFGQSLLLTGEPLVAGENVVIAAKGTAINLACRVSGFMED